MNSSGQKIFEREMDSVWEHYVRQRFAPVSKYPDARLPERATQGSVGYDMFSVEDITIPPHQIALISTGVKCYLRDCWLMLALRSSTPRKKGLMLANGIGVIDADYVDNPDNEGEIKIQVYNFTDQPVQVCEGERIAQGILIPIQMLDIDNVVNQSRVGGFGSTK